MKHLLHVEMNRKLQSGFDKSVFLFKNTGKYHVSELTRGEIDKCLNKLKRVKTLKRYVCSY